MADALGQQTYCVIDSFLRCMASSFPVERVLAAQVLSRFDWSGQVVTVSFTANEKSMQKAKFKFIATAAWKNLVSSKHSP